MVRLAIDEDATDEAQAIGRRRSNTQFVARLGEMIVAENGLTWIRRVAVAVIEGKVVGDTAVGAVVLVVGLGVVGVVGLGVELAIHIGAGIGDVESADLTLDRQSRLIEAVVAVFGEEVLDFEVADRRIVTGRTVGARVLRQQGRGDRPVVVKVDLQRGAAARHIAVVVVLLDVLAVVEGQARQVTAIAVAQAGKGACARDVVDITGVVFGPADDAQGDLVGQRRVEHALDLATLAAVIDRITIDIEAAVCAAEVRLVGDYADRAGFG